MERTPSPILWVNLVKEDGMGGATFTKQKMHTGSYWGNLKETYKENLKAEWLILLKEEARWERLDFINPGQDRGKW